MSDSIPKTSTRELPFEIAAAFDRINFPPRGRDGGKNGANIFVRGYPSAGDAEFVTFQINGVPANQDLRPSNCNSAFQVGPFALERIEVVWVGDTVTTDIACDLALGDDVEGVALLALAEQRLTVGMALPLRAAHHFPEFDVAEAGEELQPAQQREALGVEHALQLSARHVLLRDQRR